jgi:hypothetical protein
MHRLGLLVVLGARLAIADPTPDHPVALPTEYEAHRFYVTPVTVDGVRLRCYTDSGGGGAFLFDDRARALHLKSRKRTSDEGRFETVSWPSFRADAAIPPSLEPPYWIVLPHAEWPKQDDCFLGQSWFGGRVWTFDYPGKRLWTRAAGDLPPHDKAHEARLLFKERRHRRENEFPRIEVTIDGEKIPFLLDTGATVNLSRTALAELGDSGPSERGGSFITARTFVRWRKRHPDWRVLDQADELGDERSAMIEVPTVVVADHPVGPVWFAERADQNFDKFMSGMMAGHVEGALGGSALHYLRVTVDYPNAIAVFERP